MSDSFSYDVFLSHSSKDKAVVRPLAERLRKDRPVPFSQHSTHLSQPSAAPLNKERRFLPLWLDDAPIKGSDWFRKNDGVRWQFSTAPNN